MFKKSKLFFIFLLFFLSIFSLNLSLADNNSSFSIESSVRILSSGEEPGGGGSVEIERDCIFIDKTFFHVYLEQDSQIQEVLKVKNNCSINREITIDFTKILNFIKVNNESNFVFTFTLRPGEERIFNLNFFADRNTIPDLYSGLIEIFEAKIIDIGLIIEVISREPILIADLEVDPITKDIFPGQNISYILAFYDAKKSGEVRAAYDLIVKNLKNEIVDFYSSTVVFENFTEIKGDIQTSSELPPGKYIIYVKLIYKDRVSISSETITILGKSEDKKTNWLLILAIILGILAIFLIIWLILRKTALKEKRFVVIKKHAKKSKELTDAFYNHSIELNEIEREERKEKRKKRKQLGL